MKIVVEERHIKAGTWCTEEACPVALAIMEALGEGWDAYVGSEYVTVVGSDGTVKTYSLAWEITEIIDEYDTTRVMYPFGFEL